MPKCRRTTKLRCPYKGIVVRPDLHDLWVGLYWTVHHSANTACDEDIRHCTIRYDVYVCVLPCLPIHLWVELVYDEREEGGNANV